MSDRADAAFCMALTTEGLERFDILHDSIVAMYESQDYASMDHMMDLAVGTGNRGYVRSVLMTIKPVKHVTSEEKWDRLVNFLRQGNTGGKGRWIPVEENLPPIEEGADPMGRAMSKKVLVKYGMGNDTGHSVDQLYYQTGEEPRWFRRSENVIAWMEIPE